MGREQHVEAAKRQMRSCGRSMCPYRSIVCVFLSYCAVMCWWYVRELGNAQDTFRIAFESTIFPMVANSDYQVNAYGTQRTPPPPRIVQFDFVRNEKQQLGSLEVIRRGRTVEFQKLTWQRDVKQASLPRSKGVCVPMKWQRRRFLSCNNVHELETDLEFINCGGSRCAFKFLDIDGRAQVLKTKKFRGSLDSWELEDARRDAVAMERLTSSPYVASIFDFCGTSQIVEYSAHGNLFDWMKLTRSHQRKAPTPLEKLKFAIQISTGVADVHSIDQDKGLISMSHNDVCCHQFMFVDGIFKLGDFHLSTFMRQNKTSGKECPQMYQSMNSVLTKVRPPEEMSGRKVTPLDKIDVYTMGNVIYYIMTQRWTFEGMTQDQAKEALKSGNRSEIGFELKDPAEKAVAEAIRWSWTHEPSERPTARAVSNMLKEALSKLGTKRTDESVVRVPVPPLPKDYDFSDLEFYKNLGKDLDGRAVA